MAFIPHVPIEIYSNADFTAGNGVSSGSGNANDPFIIENLELNSSGSTEITIWDTDAFVVFRNIWAHGPSATGINLGNVSNAVFENVIFNTTRFSSDFYFWKFQHGAIRNSTIADSGNWMAVRLMDSADVEVSGNTFPGSGYGIAAVALEKCVDVRIEGNHFSGNDGAVSASASSGTRVRYNTFANQSSVSVYAYNSSGVQVEGNTIDSGPSDGVRLWRSTAAVVVNNTISGVLGDAINLTESGGSTLEGNRMSGAGVFIAGSTRGDYDSFFINATNLVDGKPVDYRVDCAPGVIEAPVASQLILVNCDNAEVAGFSTDRVDRPLQVAYSDNVKLSGLSLRHPTYGVAVTRSVGGTVADSVISNATQAAVDFLTTVGGAVTGSRLTSTGGTAAVHLSGASGFLLQNDTLTSALDGLNATSSSALTLRGNAFRYNGGVAISLATTTGLVAFENAFVGNALDVAGAPGGTLWNGSYPTGGNFWDRATGPDACSGPLQSSCSGGDGFLDSAYAPTLGQWDFYPRAVALDILPTANFEIAPRIGETSTTFRFDASGSAGGPNGTDPLLYEWDVGDDGVFESNGTSPTFSTSFAASGVVTVRLRVTDLGGLNGSTTHTLEVLDLTAPQVALSSPANGTIVTLAAVNVSGTASDSGGSGLDEVNAHVVGHNWTHGNNSGAWIFTLFLDPGVNVVEVQAYDRAGNPSLPARVNVTYDRLPVPVMRVNPGGNETAVWADFDASQSTDADDPITRMSFRWDYNGDGTFDTPWVGSGNQRFGYPSQGNYTVVLEARDSLGLTSRVAQNVSIPLGVDGVAPTVAHTPPRNATAGVPIPLEATASDARGVTLVWAVVFSGASASFTVDLALGPNGTYVGSIPARTQAGTVEYEIHAQDPTGNVGKAPATGRYKVNVGAAPPGPPAKGFLPGFESSAALGAAAAAAFILLQRRRRPDA